MTNPNTAALNVAAAQSLNDAVKAGALPAPTTTVYRRHNLSRRQMLDIADRYDVHIRLFNDTDDGHAFVAIDIPILDDGAIRVLYTLYSRDMTDADRLQYEAHNRDCLDDGTDRATRPSILNHQPPAAIAGSDVPPRDTGVAETNVYAPEHLNENGDPVGFHNTSAG
jgi:hypothetical protein